MSNETEHEISIPRLVRFWILLPFYIPSVICSLFVLSCLIFDRVLLKALYNHVIILLILINLIVQLTNLVWIMDYYRLGYVSIARESFCLTWLFTEEALFITTNHLFAWATIERHILIFHDRLLTNKTKRFLLHYLPLIIIIVYCMCYNIIAILLPPCENTFDYTEIVCGYPHCFYENKFLGIWDVIINDLVPIMIIIICSLTLLFRVIHQKYRMRRVLRWRDHRKMTIQLLSISLLYFIVYIPEMFMEFVYLCGVSEDIGAEFMMYAEFFTHYGTILLPFICAGSISELRKKIKRLCFWRHGQIQPAPPTNTIR